MLIEVHAIQNHSPANLNRDDLGAPKTCYFGGVMRSRISSQCLKRSIRTSEYFKLLCGGIRTRQLAGLIADKIDGTPAVKKRAAKILEQCGIKAKDDDKSDMLIYTTHEAIAQIARLLQETKGEPESLAVQCGELIAGLIAVPDMALTGRMLETGKLANTTVDAALQVAHAISTHEARPEVDYYVAADDLPGSDRGAGFVDEAIFASACFYKYFSINWDQLLENLAGFNGKKEHLAAHTVGAFLRGAALATPSGKQNSFAAHNPPDGILVEFRPTPINYANAFACPVAAFGARNPDGKPYDFVQQSIVQLGQYVRDLDVGYGPPDPDKRFWFSPNLRHPLVITEEKKEIRLAKHDLKSLDELIVEVVKALGFDWQEVQKTKIAIN